MFFQAILLSASLEAGIISGGMFNYSDANKWMQWFPVEYASLSVDVKYQYLFIGGVVETYMLPYNIIFFSPFQNTYIFRAGLNFDDKFFLVYEHSCFHPMQPYATIIGNEIKPKYEGAIDKFYIRFSTK